MRKAHTTFKLSRKNKFDFPNELVIRIVTLRHFEGLLDLIMTSSLPNLTKRGYRSCYIKFTERKTILKIVLKHSLEHS